MNNLNVKTSRMLSFREREQQCECRFSAGRPYYHLCTPGDAVSMLFEGDDDFRFAMNLVALCSFLVPELKVLTFVLMRNHIHAVMAGPEEKIRSWFRFFCARLYRYYQSTGRVRNLDAFQADLFRLDNLSFLRNTIAYVNRNGFLVYHCYTPSSYPWGANRFFFSPDSVHRCDGRIRDLNYREKRELFRSHFVDYPEDHVLLDGFISPASYCDLELAESLFRDARHYFYQISRSVEAYQEIAKMLGDSTFYTDDELYLIVRQLSRDRCGSSRPETLPMDDKLELARKLHYDYQAGNKQIQRMLRLEERTVNALFGR